ncbi:hypothetical protein [Streptomyces sp. NPDC050255]|uniref:hypothetical protein n=1 Tax=Streptomyces sp. NPDC050255 TaxID=3365606 RepID=UPI003789E3B1
MHRLGLAAAAAVLVVLPITGCSGSEDTPGAATARSAKADASASASPASRRNKASEESLKQAEKDVRFATEPEGELSMHERREGFCITQATLPTVKPLGRAAFEAVVQRLQTRGWTLDGPLDTFDDPSGTMFYAIVESGEWRISLGSSSMPPEGMEEYAPNQGTVAIAISWSCKPG